MDYLQEAMVKLASSRDSQEEFATEAALFAQQSQAAALIAICERLDKLAEQLSGGKGRPLPAPIPATPGNAMEWDRDNPEDSGRCFCPRCGYLVAAHLEGKCPRDNQEACERLGLPWPSR